jgi:putative salt-induced outer membrane protein YdiY
MRWSGFVLALALVAFAGVPEAAAQDAPPPDSTAGLIDIGYVQTSGNTDVQTVTGRERVEHYAGAWTFAQELTAVQGETSDIETTARYTALLRAGYDLSERIGLYLRANGGASPTRACRVSSTRASAPRCTRSGPARTSSTSSRASACCSAG